MINMFIFIKYYYIINILLHLVFIFVALVVCTVSYNIYLFYFQQKRSFLAYSMAATEK